MTDISAPSALDAVVGDPTTVVVPAAGLSLLLKHAEHAVRLRLSVLLGQADLNLEHWRILSVLLTQPGLRMSTIAESAVVPPATLTRLMDTLVERALVVRRVDPDDKRRVVAALSDHGRKFAEQVKVQEQALEELLIQRLGPDRTENLLRDLTVLPHVLG